MKKRNIVGISLFSAILLGSISYTQVKAEDIQASSSTNVTNVVTNGNEETQDPSIQPVQSDSQTDVKDTEDSDEEVTSTNNLDEKANQDDEKSNETIDNTQNNTSSNSVVTQDTPADSVADPASDEQQVNIYIKNQHGEIVKDNYGNNICVYTGERKVGDVVGTTESIIPKNLKVLYKVSSDQSMIVEKGVSDYYFNAEGRKAFLTYEKFVNGKRANISFQSSRSDVLYHNTLLDKSKWTYVYAGDIFNSSDASYPGDSFTDADGYKPEIYVEQLDESGKIIEIPINSNNGDVLVNSYFRDETTYYNTDFYFGCIFYFEEPIPVLYQDSEGNNISEKGAGILNAKNDDGDIDTPDYTKYAKKIDGYTFQNSLSSYVMEWDSDGSLNLDTSKLVIGYSKDDEAYPVINYRDSDGNIIYSDSNYNLNLQPEEIPDISTLNNSEFADFQNGEITKTDTGYDVTIKDQGVSFRVIQKVGNLIISDNYTDITLNNGVKQVQFQGNVGNYKLNMDKSIYACDSYASDDVSLSFTKGGLSELGITDMKGLIAYQNGVINDDFITSSLRDKYVLTGIYDSEPSQVTINYVDDSGNNVSSSTRDYPTVDNTTVDQIIQLPKGYKMSGVPTAVGNDSDDTNLVLEVTVAKDPNSNTSSGGGGSSSSNNENNSNFVKINQKLSVKDKNVTIVDSKGNPVSMPLKRYSNWVTDKRMTIKGETYYRVASDRWVDEKDIYIYTDNVSQVHAYYDDNKSLIDYDSNKENRALKLGTDWATDRYAYFNGQKYYRVATNEWVKDSDILEYQPVTMTVNTAGTTVYDEFGNNVGALAAGSYKADRTSTINNVKMYRVATNEWIQVN